MAKDKAFSTYDSIKDKLLRVKSKHVKLNEEINTLKEKFSSLEAELKEVKSHYQSLEKENSRLKLAKSLVSTSSDKAEMKFKVNEMVREIDKCIALLNR
ncbi:MAG: hypothetical protein MK086_10035 [Flavobacteriales bacterium]|nr:hypothetical protein [Flavobacteriales bacterium]